jgi:VanZ family protein
MCTTWSSRAKHRIIAWSKREERGVILSEAKDLKAKSPAGKLALRSAITPGIALRTWIPAVGWTLMTIAASGDLFSARHTGGFVIWFFRTFFPNVPYDAYDIAHTYLRKFGHFTNYAILSWLWFRAARYWELREPSRLWELRWAFWGFAFAVATALCDEGLQHFVPSRTGSWADVLLDSCGALFAQLLIFRIWIMRQQRSARASQA